jgi:SAM-dependent methyltransferase
MSGRGDPANWYAAVDSDVPSFYDRGLGPVFFVDFADDIARRTAASTPSRVLETAAGTGIVSRRLRDLLPAAAQLTVTDLNPAMLDVARSKFDAGERVSIEPADTAALPFPDAAFEALVCQFGLMFFPDKDRVFREAHRVLTGYGRYLFSVWDSQHYNPIGPLQIGIAANFFPSDPPRFFEAPLSCYRIDPIKDGLHEAGFSEIRVEVLSREQNIPDVAAFARALVHGSPFIAEIRARGGVDPEQVVEALRDALPREFGTAPTRLPLQAIVFEATRR